MHLASHTQVNTAFRFLASVFGAWLESVFISILVILFLQILITARIGIDTAFRVDMLILSAAVVAVTWLYLTKQRTRPTRLQLIGVGIGWALLTIVAEWAFRQYVRDHVILKFLINTIMDDEGLSREQLWRLFLLAQLLAPVLLGGVRDVVALRRRKRSGRLVGRNGT